MRASETNPQQPRQKSELQKMLDWQDRYGPYIKWPVLALTFVGVGTMIVSGIFRMAGYPLW